jgi:hypothetical protein
MTITTTIPTEKVRIELDSFGDSGIDENGNHWTRFEVDYFAEQEAGTCDICKVGDLEFGWLLRDGGEEICDSHVEVS